MFNFILLSVLMISTIFINLANASQDNMCLMASKNVVFEGDNNPLTEYELKKLNLIIAEKVFERAKSNKGFYKKNYASWKEWYDDSDWSKIGNNGIRGYGISMAGFGPIYNAYGVVFNDGSFAVGIIGKDTKYGDDNWVTLAGDNWHVNQDPRDGHGGQMFFDKNGRPVALAITNGIDATFGTGWSYIYKNGKWEYESKDDWHKRRFAKSTESLDPHAPKFLIN